MNKTWLLLFAFVLMSLQSLPVHAESYSYPYLTFVTSSGETTLSVSSLNMSISGTTLTVVNSDGTNTFSLSDLTKMYFSSSSTGIAGVNDSDNEEVEVFVVDGVSMGKFANKATALKALKKGVYVLKTKNETFKVAVQ